jgi:hypothetical protein
MATAEDGEVRTGLQEASAQGSFTQGGEPKSPKRIDAQDRADGDRVEESERTPSANDPQLEQIAPYDASVSPEERRRMICEAAYYLAQRRGFYGGMELEDWLQAEVEIDARLGTSST